MICKREYQPQGLLLSLLARSKGFCPGTPVPIVSLALVAAPKKQYTVLFFYGLFESLFNISKTKKEPAY